MSVIGSAFARYKYKSFKRTFLVVWLVSRVVIIIAYTLIRTNLLAERKAALIPL